MRGEELQRRVDLCTVEVRQIMAIITVAAEGD